MCANEILCGEGSHLGGEQNGILLSKPAASKISIEIYHEKYNFKYKLFTNSSSSLITFRMPKCDITWSDDLISVKCCISVSAENKELHRFEYNYINYENKLLMENRRNNMEILKLMNEILHPQQKNTKIETDNNSTLSKNIFEISAKTKINYLKEDLNQIKLSTELHRKAPIYRPSYMKVKNCKY